MKGGRISLFFRAHLTGVLGAVLGLVLFASSVRAEPDAVLTAAEGPVEVRPYGEKKYAAAAPGFPLTYGDRIKTGAKGLAHVEFSNGTEVLVKENSFFMIGGESRRYWVSFDIGEFLVGIKRSLAPGESFLVRTPAAVAAVRGTLFWGKSDEKKDSYWTGFGHKVAISARKKTVILLPGQTIRVRRGEAPENPQPSATPVAYLQTFAVKNGIQGLEKLVDPAVR